MKSFFIPILVLSICASVQAQTVNLQELEAHFLVNNTQLIASKYAIDKADALIVQEKLWQNPTLSVSEVNLWKTYRVEEQPYLWGTYGKNQQISVELEQVIETAGKRKKRVALKRLEKQSAVLEYEELMRELKKELRLSYHRLNRIKQEEVQLLNSLTLFSQLNEKYEKQAKAQNIATSDFYRVQTELVDLQKEQVILENEKWEALNSLRILTHLPNLQLSEIVFSTNQISKHSLPLDVLNDVNLQNIGVKRQANEIKIAESQLLLEKAERTPNLILQMNYDRGGNIMRDFIGFGVSVDLPIFNNNKGNIKASEAMIKQQQSTLFSMEHSVKQTVINLHEQLNRLSTTLNNWPSKDTEGQLQILENYKKHLQNKQITLLEFIDFTQAYRQANQAFFQLQETYNTTLEELQYTVGKDL